MENMLEVNLSMSSLDFLNNVINPARVFAGESALRNTEMVRKIQDELDLTVADFLQATPESGGTPQNYIMLTFDQMMLVGMRESKQVRKNVVERLKRMKTVDRPHPILPQDYASALRALANEVEAKQLALSERDEAIRTKAEIGNRREATAMATASVAVRKVYALEDELGKGKTYKQVKAIPWLLDVFAPSRGMYTVVGKTLTTMSKEEGLPIERIQSSEFPEGVNAYHVRVIDRLGARLVDDPDMLGKYRRIDDVR